ncbi:hypothetical protein [Stenomitos frigidus]|uniref:DUF928 domain-containing protein n=1 Tax=Stenomitos frigidus ULC18 TaxID=2107698 RepID=A0A2T1DSM0_9CYAN|nr:hypothetical protein [Stenomitos frigidus]PSB23488.1 hypothetical protein C7B82_30955 [Stenomitos frigidus ULC18]
MRKISKKWLPLLMVAVVGLVGLPGLAQSSLFSQKFALEPLETQTHAQVGVPRLNASLDQLELSFKRKLPGRSGGSRGDDLVSPIAPGLLDYVIWSDRPSFFWWTEATSNVALQKLELFQDQLRAESLWEKPLANADQKAEYNGRALQHGQKYFWNLTWSQQKPTSGTGITLTTLNRKFRVMAAPERNQIAVDLQMIANKLRAAKASEEAIAIQQAAYFTERGLLSDALQVLGQVKNPSVEMTKTLQRLIQESINTLYPPPKK